MSHVTIEVEPRDSGGKNANRRLRAAGQIPAVVYGAGKEPVPIQIKERAFEDFLKAAGGENAIFLLQLTGTDKSRHTMIREMQRNHLTGDLLHVDFLRVMLDQKVRASVRIEVRGEPEGVKTEGGLLDFVTREVEVQCLPEKIPTHFELDVSALNIGQHLEAKDLEMPEDVELQVAPERVIVSIAGPRGGAEDEEVEEDLLEKITAEPEIIGRGKPDEE